MDLERVFSDEKYDEDIGVDSGSFSVEAFSARWDLDLKVNRRRGTIASPSPGRFQGKKVGTFTIGTWIMGSVLESS